jgi:hypothetical protein
VADDANLFRRYLLGELDETEQEAIEKKLMTGDEPFQELLIAEEELVDDFCEGTLSASEEEHYRDHFLTTPERRFQHRFGATLREHLSALETPEAIAPRADPTLRRPFGGTWRTVFAVAAAALLASGIWWILEQRPIHLIPRTDSAETTAAFFLTAGALRSAEPPTELSFTVPAGASFVDLQLEVPNGAPGDREVQILDQLGRIRAQGTLPIEIIEGESVVVARVPSERLPPGEYRVLLRAASTDGEPATPRTYEFRIESP